MMKKCLQYRCMDTDLALGGLLGTSGSNSTGKPKKPLNLSKVTCATWRTLVGEPMFIIMEQMFLRESWKDFLRRVRRRAKRGRRRKALLWEENEEVVVVVVVVLVFVGGDEEATKWGGDEEWRTSVMAGNERSLYLEYKKRKQQRFCFRKCQGLVSWSWIQGNCTSVCRVWDVRIINSVFKLCYVACCGAFNKERETGRVEHRQQKIKLLRNQMKTWKWWKLVKEYHNNNEIFFLHF